MTLESSELMQTNSTKITNNTSNRSNSSGNNRSSVDTNIASSSCNIVNAQDVQPCGSLSLDTIVDGTSRTTVDETLLSTPSSSSSTPFAKVHVTDGHPDHDEVPVPNSPLRNKSGGYWQLKRGDLVRLSER
jgi:hypothetical protein